MGLFSKKDEYRKDDDIVRVRQSNENNDHIRVDKYQPTENGGHTHSSCNLDRSSGNYKEYHGGENSAERSYNKT